MSIMFKNGAEMLLKQGFFEFERRKKFMAFFFERRGQAQVDDTFLPLSAPKCLFPVNRLQP